MSQYITRDELKTYLGISTTDDDSALSGFITGASKLIDSHCKRTIYAGSDETRYFDAVGDHIIDGRTLLLDGDLSSVTTVTNGDGNAITSSYYTLVPANRPPYYAIRILASYTSTWTYTTNWENAISITGRWCYATRVPDDIVEVMKHWASYLYKLKDSQVFDVTAAPEFGTLTIPKGIPAFVKEALRHYRKVVI